jgi:Ca-activated chloride channel family protein
MVYQYGSVLGSQGPVVGPLKLISIVGVLLGGITWWSAEPTAQGAPVAAFTSSVDLVRVTAVVRDGRGRLVGDLTARDFEILDDGERRHISDFRHDSSGVSVALLFDASGSMAALMGQAREAAGHLLLALESGRDEAAVFTFDTQLEEVAAFTSDLAGLPARLDSVRPFGATSLHDAIAKAAERSSLRPGRRRAVIVFTDGNDNFSRLTPGEVSGIASAIDVPVYIVGLVSIVDDPAADIGAAPPGSPLSGALSQLTMWTGGRTFVVSRPAQRSGVARQIVDELRHQYLMTFESSGAPGWHPLEVRARGRNLSVRARGGYLAGQSRPIWQ